MKPNYRRIISLVLTVLLGANFLQGSGANYATDQKLARKIGSELWNSMDPEQKQLFRPDCVLIAEDAEPWVKPVEIRNDNVAGRYVAVSSGFIDLMNNVSHAKAIDQFEPGYFQRYLKQLATESGRFPLQSIQDVFNEKYWTTEIVNEQESNFNQMVAMTLAIQLSHHTLGHYDKHQGDLEDPNDDRPINELINGREWEDAFKAGLKLTLEAGYGVEGFEALCQALDRMPRRPDWTTYFLPQRVDVAQLENTMERSEQEFFNFFGEP